MLDLAASKDVNFSAVDHLGMASYLSGRAVASTRWYKDSFGADYPIKRRHIVPFLF